MAHNLTISFQQCKFVCMQQHLKILQNYSTVFYSLIRSVDFTRNIGNTPFMATLTFLFIGRFVGLSLSIESAITWKVSIPFHYELCNCRLWFSILGIYRRTNLIVVIETRFIVLSNTVVDCRHGQFYSLK